MRTGTSSRLSWITGILLALLALPLSCWVRGAIVERRLRSSKLLRVVSEQGLPVAEATVLAAYFEVAEASGPTCVVDQLAELRADDRGEAVLRGLAPEYMARDSWKLWVRVEAPGAPPEVGYWTGEPFVVGPARELRGRISL